MPYTSIDYSDYISSTTGLGRGVIFTGDTYQPRTFNPYTWTDWSAVKTQMEISEEDVPEMKIDEFRDDKTDNRKYAVACSCDSDLSQEHVLKSISIMKSKLMLRCAPYRVMNIECKMTPTVKDNMIKAYRKLNMFGKKTPFVASFDEYGRRLPDDIKIDTIRGMDIKIVDPEYYGISYLVFEAVVPEKYIKDPSYVDPEDLPF